MFARKEISTLLDVLSFAADKHRDQRRKDPEATPYINHPIEVAQLLWDVGETQDLVLICGALLHDTIEDTTTTAEELQENFGPEVCALVQEVTDDKSLPKETRKQLQIEHAADKSERAKQLKLADKICNVRDLVRSPPRNWTHGRRRQYLEWSTSVINQIRGANPRMEAMFDALVADGHRALDQEEQ